MYDFNRCKLCALPSAVKTYRLKSAHLYCCPACDFHYIDQLDDLAQPVEAAVLDERTARLIEAKLVDNARLHRARLGFVKKHAPLNQAQCLDIGTGVGLYPHLLAETGATVRGIEPSSLNRAFAQKKFGLELDPHFIDHPDWQEGARDTFDQATLWDVIEHVNFPRETLAQTFTVLKPGGWLFLDTPSRDSLYYRLSEFVCRSSHGTNPLFLGSLYSSARFGHKQIFRPRQLAQLLSEVGFEIITLQGFHDLDLPVAPGLNRRLNTVAAWVRPQDKIVIACRKPATRTS